MRERGKRASVFEGHPIDGALVFVGSCAALAQDPRSLRARARAGRGDGGLRRGSGRRRAAEAGRLRAWALAAREKRQRAGRARPIRSCTLSRPARTRPPFLHVTHLWSSAHCAGPPGGAGWWPCPGRPAPGRPSWRCRRPSVRPQGPPRAGRRWRCRPWCEKRVRVCAGGAKERGYVRACWPRPVSALLSRREGMKGVRTAVRTQRWRSGVASSPPHSRSLSCLRARPCVSLCLRTAHKENPGMPPARAQPTRAAKRARRAESEGPSGSASGAEEGGRRRRVSFILGGAGQQWPGGRRRAARGDWFTPRAHGQTVSSARQLVPGREVRVVA